MLKFLYYNILRHLFYFTFTIFISVSFIPLLIMPKPRSYSFPNPPENCNFNTEVDRILEKRLGEFIIELNLVETAQ